MRKRKGNNKTVGDMKEKLICSRCGAEIEEGFEYGTEEEPLCDECYYDDTDICPICEEHFEPVGGEGRFHDAVKEGEEYFFITKESSELTHKPIGMYRVKEHPFFWGDCVSGFDAFISDAIEQVNDIDIEAHLDKQYPRNEHHVPLAMICPECAKKYVNIK